jgi:hypothetical protein
MIKAGYSTPMLRVRDVTRSILFYEQLGLAGQFRGFATGLGASALYRRARLCYQPTFPLMSSSLGRISR